MAVVVVDAGPLIGLARVGALTVLRHLFCSCCLPPAVWAECRGKEGVDRRRIEKAVEDGWLRVTAAPPSAAPFPPSLGLGEVEAIRLAESTQSALLVVDDRLARREAHRRGLAYIGTAHTLLLAERRSIIDDAEALIGRMAEHGYRISSSILQYLRSQEP